MDSSNEELTKMVIAEKDKINLKYKQKLNSIKQHYGVEFDVDHFKDNRIKNIKFSNLKYNGNINNISISYNHTSSKFDYINYEYKHDSDIKDINSKILYTDLIKDYRLNLIVSEIDKINNEYINELYKIENNFNLISNSKEYVKTFQINQNEEDN